eukprot:765103-Hanusia_phi.AAC.1
MPWRVDVTWQQDERTACGSGWHRTPDAAGAALVQVTEKLTVISLQDFKQEGESGGPHSKVFIKSVVHGGSCHRDGVVQVRHVVVAGEAGEVCMAQEGDKILQVNGENVVGYSVADIRERIVGPIGSYVRVVFEKATTGETFEVGLSCSCRTNWFNDRER